jgi:hypothetical protein
MWLIPLGDNGMENKIKHLEMIQSIINRMGSDSFYVKGWSILIVSALFVLAAKDARVAFVLLAYFPALAFWILDGYFLWQERLYRDLYDNVRKLREDEVDFSMDTGVVSAAVRPWSEVAFSKTLVVFHGVIMLTIVIVMFATAR